MSVELVYTSVVKGIKPGSSGFCTAGATAGMSKTLIMKLEMLSGYEFMYNISDSNANLNPINYAHTLLETPGQVSSVISRIGFSGADYTGRANKIAHHFLMKPNERHIGGPAWMAWQMEQQKKFMTTWEGEAREFPARSMDNLLKIAPPTSTSAAKWEAITGDSGWGGALIEAFREKPKIPAYVIFKPGTDILSLFNESMCLLPPSERWQIGFATYYTTLPAGCFYHWRGVAAGSAAVQEIRRFPDATVIDLTTSLSQPQDNSYTQAARTGQGLPPVKTASSIGSSNQTPIQVTPQPQRRVPSVAKEQNYQSPAVTIYRNTTGMKILAVSLAFLVFSLLVTIFMLRINEPEKTQVKPGINEELKTNKENLENTETKLKTIEDELIKIKEVLKENKEKLTKANEKNAELNKRLSQSENKSIVFDYEPKPRASHLHDKKFIRLDLQDDQRFEIAQSYFLLDFPEILNKKVRFNGGPMLSISPKGDVFCINYFKKTGPTSIYKPETLLECNVQTNSKSHIFTLKNIVGKGKYDDVINNLVFEFVDPNTIYQCSLRDEIALTQKLFKIDSDNNVVDPNSIDIKYPWPETLVLQNLNTKEIIDSELVLGKGMFCLITRSNKKDGVGVIIELDKKTKEYINNNIYLYYDNQRYRDQHDGRLDDRTPSNIRSIVNMINKNGIIRVVDAWGVEVERINLKFIMPRDNH